MGHNWDKHNNKKKNEWKKKKTGTNQTREHNKNKNYNLSYLNTEKWIQNLDFLCY